MQRQLSRMARTSSRAGDPHSPGFSLVTTLALVHGCMRCTRDSQCHQYWRPTHNHRPPSGCLRRTWALGALRPVVLVGGGGDGSGCSAGSCWPSAHVHMPSPCSPSLAFFALLLKRNTFAKSLPVSLRASSSSRQNLEERKQTQLLSTIK